MGQPNNRDAQPFCFADQRRGQRIVLGESRMLYNITLLTPGNPLQPIVGWPQLARNSEGGLQLEATNIPVLKVNLRVKLLKNRERSMTLPGEVFTQPQRADDFNRF